MRSIYRSDQAKASGEILRITSQLTRMSSGMWKSQNGQLCQRRHNTQPWRTYQRELMTRGNINGELGVAIIGQWLPVRMDPTNACRPGEGRKLLKHRFEPGRGEVKRFWYPRSLSVREMERSAFWINQDPESNQEWLLWFVPGYYRLSIINWICNLFSGRWLIQTSQMIS